MNYLKHSLINARDFLLGTREYFRNVLLMHGFMLFLLIPLLSRSTNFILRQGGIPYISFDNIGQILTQHLWVTLALLVVLIGIILAIFFEFTFLLLSVYFIKKKQPIRLMQLLKVTLKQMKKVRIETILFFFFYFFLVLPIGGLSFQSDLLTKVKIPAFILDFIFANRLLFISAFVLLYLAMLYLGIRLIFALPEMILRDRPFKLAVKESWHLTKKRFISIVAQFLIITGTTLALTSLGFFVVVSIQRLIEHFYPDNSLISAVFAMTFLQFFLLINIVLSTVGIFYVIVDFMDDEGFLPDTPHWFVEQAASKYTGLMQSLLFVAAIFFGVGVSLYNYDYLTNFNLHTPIKVSHRGVSNGNGVQNSITALEKTSESYHPDYIEMDVQLTNDGEFIVFHDFNFKALTGVSKKPENSSLEDALSLTVEENGMTSPIHTFDEYLAAAEAIGQKLIVEIKTQKKNTQELTERFVEKYATRLIEDGHIVQSLTFQVIEDLKTLAPNLTAGYILPFNLVGPPDSQADFLTLEYTTLNRSFIQTAQSDGTSVFVWTTNDSDTINRMMFYGVDGMITDQMALLNQTTTKPEIMTYSDKLMNFVLGFG